MDKQLKTNNMKSLIQNSILFTIFFFSVLMILGVVEHDQEIDIYFWLVKLSGVVLGWIGVKLAKRWNWLGINDKEELA